MEEFELDTFLSQNLRVKRYNKEEGNFYLSYNSYDEEWVLRWDISLQTQFIYFEEVEKEILKTLTEKGITMRELRETYRYLGWL